tara:strand:- start:949 stop:1764 length:816 start_codon:yes stop_codon:yes gene_type:complete
MSGGHHASAADEVCVGSAEGEDASIAEPPVKCLDELPEDMIVQVVKSTDLSALCVLKAVGKVWCLRSRQELFARLYSHSRESTNDAPWDTLNVEVLWATGRPHDVVAAGRVELLEWVGQLEWLHGYGFKVDVSALRKVELCSTHNSLSGLWEGTNNDIVTWSPFETGPALRACFTPSDSMPPRELLLVTLACAGRGSPLGIPVQHLRDVDADPDDYGDAFNQADADGPELDLSDRTLDADHMQLLALLLPGSKVERLMHAPAPKQHVTYRF